jgi:hypothetical protein
VSLEMVSTKRNRVYQRTFDHDKARALHEADPLRWTCAELARYFDVNYNSVRRILDPSEDARTRSRAAQWFRDHRVPCKGECGRLVYGHHKGRTGYCRSCVGGHLTSSVRESELKCGRCGEWKPDEAFPHRHKAKARRGRHSQCRACATLARQDHRLRNQEASKKYDRAYKRATRERTAPMTTFIVFTPNGDGLKEVARVEAASAIGAVEAAATQAGQYVAITEGRFNLMQVEPVQKMTVVRQ